MTVHRRQHTLPHRRFRAGFGTPPRWTAAALCLLALAAACGAPEPEPPAPAPGASSAPAGETGAAPGPPPLVLLVTFDTTRADHVSAYGHLRETSPHIDSLAAEGLVFENATATASWTLPAHASLFTGKVTTSHGARYDEAGPLRLTSAIEGPASWDGYRARGLSRAETTLAGLLDDAGFATAAVVAGPWMKRVFGLSTGFAHYDDGGIHTVTGRLAADVSDAALAWLATVPDRPVFLFLNYFDPHSPYGAPEPFTQFFARGQDLVRPGSRRDVLSRYDGEIRYADDQFGRVLAALRESGRFRNAMIVVTSDHGELFGEHGANGHGSTLWQEEIHVPLVVKPFGPPRAPERIATRVSHTDVLPMILGALGLAVPAPIQGGALPDPGHPVVAEAYPSPFVSRGGAWRVWFEGSWKLAWSGQGRHGLYDLARDPRELRNLAREEPARVAEMTAALEDYLADLPRPPAADGPAEVDADTQRALRALGYVE